MLCSDKTGTLTKNKMTIQDDAPTYEPNLTQMDLLKQSALAAKWDSPPKDALDTLFLRCHLWYPGIQQALQDYVASRPQITQAEKDEWYEPCIPLLLIFSFKYRQVQFSGQRKASGGTARLRESSFHAI